MAGGQFLGKSHVEGQGNRPMVNVHATKTHQFIFRISPSLLFLCILNVLVALATLAIVAKPVAMLFNRPLEEDGFYVLNVARHIGLGLGISVDGHTPTNGFQPLWVFLCAPLFWLAHGGRELGIRLVLGFHWLLYIGAAFIFGSVTATIMRGVTGLAPRTVSILASLVYLTSARIWMNSFNGLETSLSQFVLLVTLSYYQTHADRGRAYLAACGLLLGLCVLSRIDAVFLVVFLAAARLMRPLSRARRIEDAAIISGFAFLVSLPWWAFNYANFHNLMPSSGLALQEWAPSAERFLMGLQALLLDATPLF